MQMGAEKCTFSVYYLPKCVFLYNFAANLFPSMMNINSFVRQLCMTLLLLTATMQTAVFTSCSTTKNAVECVIQKEFPELPAIRKDAVYSSRIISVRRIAEEDEARDAIPAGSYKDAVAKLTPKDVLYQTDPEGKTIASIPLLAAMIDCHANYHSSARMQAIFDNAYKDGEYFTTQVLAIAAENDFYLEGLENAVKGASHIVDKAERWLTWWREEYKQPEATLEDVADSFNDIVRYSLITTKDRYVDATLALIESLKTHGYTIEMVDNRFLDKNGNQDFGKTYRAIHLTVRCKGRLIEMQVHDYSSQSIREYTHELYEKMRQLDPKSDEYKQLSKMCIDAWKDYVNPQGIERVK